MNAAERQQAIAREDEIIAQGDHNARAAQRRVTLSLIIGLAASAAGVLLGRAL